MKKRIIVVLLILLFATGCTCEYNLKIENGKVNEEVKIMSNNPEEVSQFNNSWTIPVNKDLYNIPGDTETKQKVDEVYKYNLSGNTLTFTYEFPISKYHKSSAASNCYNTVSATRYNNSTIISTSSKATCFASHPDLSSITVNITIDGKVVSHNADKVSGNIYTWNLNKDNASNKPINLVIDNSVTPSQSTEPSSSSNNQMNVVKKDYTYYIFCGILLVAFLLGYLIFNKMRNKDKDIDI